MNKIFIYIMQYNIIYTNYNLIGGGYYTINK